MDVIVAILPMGKLRRGEAEPPSEAPAVGLGFKRRPPACRSVLSSTVTVHLTQQGQSQHRCSHPELLGWGRVGGPQPAAAPRSPLKNGQGPRPAASPSPLWCLSLLQAPVGLALPEVQPSPSPPLQITARTRRPCLGRATAPSVSDRAPPLSSTPRSQLCEPQDPAARQRAHRPTPWGSWLGVQGA